MSMDIGRFLVATLSLVIIAQSGTGSYVKNEIGCGIANGACEQGDFLHAFSSPSLDDCQQDCQEDSDCTFFTYNSANEECIEFYECHSFSTSFCPDDCQSGSIECKCAEPGECNGELIGASFVDQNSCIEECFNNPDCNWWNHYSSDSFCVLLFNCTSIDMTCTDCNHGEQACYNQVQDVDVLFVTSGYSANGYDETVEVIPLDSPQIVCPAIPDIPSAHEYAHGFLHEKQPVVCALLSNKQCYKFNTNTWQWEDYVETIEMRARAGGTFLGGNYILLGGYYSQNTTEIFSAVSEVWSPGPEIPYDVHYSCATTFQDDQVILTGGYNFIDTYLSTAAVLNARSGTWSYLPQLIMPRERHTCGIATFADGTSFVVVAGGFNGESMQLSNSEVFQLNSGAMAWSKGVDIPSGPLEQACSIPYQNGFLVIGGTPDDYTSLSSIWQYDPDNSAMPWILRPEELHMARRSSPVAILMKAKDLNCTPSAHLE